MGEEKEKEIRSFEEDEDQAANVARNAEIKEAKAPKIRCLLKYEECCPTCDVKYNSLHQRTPIKRVINVELFFIFRLTEIGTGKAFHFIYFNFLTF